MTPYFRLMADKEASDMFFCTGTEPHIKIQGVIRPVGTQKLAPGDVRDMAYALMNEEQAAEFERTLEMNFAVPLKGVGRFRVNISVNGVNAPSLSAISKPRSRVLKKCICRRY